MFFGPEVGALSKGRQRKTYLIAFIDDMSRLIPHAEFYLHERLEGFLEAYRKALRMRGLPRKLYVDNGPSFRSNHLEHICASLGIVLLHARPYQPEGKGKIERLKHLLLALILAGQNNLIDNLMFRQSRALASRIVARGHLEALNLHQK